MLKEEYLKIASSLTNLPVSFLTQLYKLNMLVISNELHTQILQKMPVKKVSLGTFGEVRIQLENNNLTYKFIPSDEFNHVIRTTIIEDKDLLQDTLEEKLVRKIYNNYSDFIDGTLEDSENKSRISTVYSDLIKYVNTAKSLSREDITDAIYRSFIKIGMKEVNNGKRIKEQN